MSTFGQKVFIAVLILGAAAGMFYWAYSYDEKLKQEGVKAKKAILYTIRGVLALIAVAGVQHSLYKSGDVFGWLFFNDLFMDIYRLAF